MGLWRRPDTGGAGPRAAGGWADAARSRSVPHRATGRLSPGRCACGSRRPWLGAAVVGAGRQALSGLVWLGLSGVSLPTGTADQVRSWCAGPPTGGAPCCTAALPADCRPADPGA